jgi:hypothetical protein
LRGFQTSWEVVERLGSDGAARGVAGSLTGAAAHAVAKSGLVHAAGVTTGEIHDAKVMDRLIREDHRAVYGDEGYASHDGTGTDGTGD